MAKNSLKIKHISGHVPAYNNDDNEPGLKGNSVFSIGKNANEQTEIPFFIGEMPEKSLPASVEMSKKSRFL